MSRLYQRVWAFDLGLRNQNAKRYELMSIRFNSKQNGSNTPTTCDMTIYNPDPEIVGTLSNKDALMRVYAGYEDSGIIEVAQGTIVSGSIQDRSISQEPQISFQISKGREISNNYTLSKSWTDVTASEVIEYIRKELSLAYDVSELGMNPRYSRGYTIRGSALSILPELMRDCGSQFTINEGRLRIWPKNKPAKVLIDVLAADTGLLECQAQGSGNSKTIAAIALMRPGLRAGDVVKFESKQYEGQLLCKEVGHEGDTYGDAWYTHIKGVPYG